jgi:hypothetical protein
MYGGLIVSLPRVCQCLESSCPVFSIGARYQPGAARQKEAVSTITAPFRTPEIADPAV